MKADSFLDEAEQAAPSAESFLGSPEVKASAESFLGESAAPRQPDALTIQEAQRASMGAIQAVDLMGAPGQLDWRDVNEQMDAQRLQEAEAARAQAALAESKGSGTGPGSEAYQWKREADFQLANISPNTRAGQMLAQQQAGELRGIMETNAPQPTTPAEAISGFLGPGLASVVMPAVEGFASQAGAALGGAAAAARFIPHPGTNIAAQLALPIAGALMGGQVGAAGQEALLQTTETPEETQQRQERLAQTAEASPGTFRLGAIASGLPYFRPGIAQFAQAGAGDVGALRNLALGGALGAGTEVGMAMVRGEKVKSEDLAAAIFSGIFLNEPTKLGRKLGLHPSFEQQAIEAAQNRVTPPETTSIAKEMDIFAPAAPGRTSISEAFPNRQPIQADAQQISKTSPPDVGVRAPEVPPQNEGLPANEGGEGVQPSGQKGPLVENAPAAPREIIPSEVTAPEGIRYDGVTKLGEEGFYSFSDTTSIPGRTVSVTLEGTTPPTTEQIRSAMDAKIAEFQQAPPEAAPGAEPAAAPAAEATPTPPAPRAIPEPGDLGWATSNKESVVNAERAERALDPVVKEAAIENPQSIDYAERAIEADPALPNRIVERLRTDPMERKISTGDAAVLLIHRTALRKRRDAAMARVAKKEGSALDQAIAREEFFAIENELNSLDQAAQDARSTWGRFGQLWQRSMREDFSLANLERRARMAKDGPLNESDLSKLSALADKAKAAQDAIEARTKEVAQENTQSAIDAKISEVKSANAAAEPQLSPAIKSLVDRVVARLDSAATNAEKSLRSRLANLGSAPDPLIVLDVAKMAAARTAKATIEFGQWAAEMVGKFGEKVRPFLQTGWEQKDQFTDKIIGSTTATKRKEVAEGMKSKTPLNAAAQQARIETAIGDRIAEGKPLSSLASYVNKLQEQFIRQGVDQRDALVDSVHGVLQKFDSTISRDATMEVMAKYGEEYATPLNRDAAKQTRRQLDGEIQQILKLRDLAAKVPLPKSGPERPTPGPAWRALIKKVNEAKRKLGVVVTDPETQLRSAQDAIRARLRNEIEDMTLELETGEKPAGRSQTDYTQEMELLRSMRDRVRETLRDIEQKPGITDEQRLALAKRSAEASLALWERRLAGERQSQPKGKITTPEIEVIRTKRDAIKAQIEEIDAADAVLQENRKAETLVKQIQDTEERLTSNAVRAKVQGADSQLVTEARAQLRALQEQLSTKRAADPARQLEQINKAEAALEASIQKLSSDIEAGNSADKRNVKAPQSERIEFLRAQREALARLRAQIEREANRPSEAEQKAAAIKKSEDALEASIQKLSSDIEAGNSADKRNVKAPQSERIEFLRAQREALARLRAQIEREANRPSEAEQKAAAIKKSEDALEASIQKLSSDIEAGAVGPQARKTPATSERLDYLRAQRDALLRLKNQLRNEARPRLSPDQLAIKAATARALARAEELQRRIAAKDFGPRTRKPPVDVSGDKKALDARAELMRVDAEYQKLQEQWKLDQLTWTQRRLRNVGQAWDAGSNLFLSFDLSTPIQTAFAMLSRPVEGAKAIGKGARAFGEQFFKFSDAYAAREAARIADSPNAKNGVYKAMGLELPNVLGKKREENMGSVLERLADLDARWAGVPDVLKGTLKMEGKTLLRGAKRLGSVVPKVLGSGIKASNAAFETIANTMRARTADLMLKRWYGRNGVPTKEQLQLLGEQINVATGKGGLKAGDSIRRLLFAPNYYLSIIKQLTGYQLGKALARHEGKVAREIAEEYVRAALTLGGIYTLALVFGDRDQMTLDPRDKSFGRAVTDSGTTLDITMGRGSWINTAAQIATGEKIKGGEVVEQDRKGAFLNFLGGRLNRGVSTALTSAFGKDYRGRDIEASDIAKDFVTPLAWRDFDKVLEKEGITRGSFIQLLNILGITHNIQD